MSSCPALLGHDAGGIAAALRSIDCSTGQATALAFGRSFGPDGRLLPALTLILTLYVALFAIGMLTGRSRIGVASLTPRMLTLGLVLTFATSWAAYQNVIWTLATGAPDQIASIIAGTQGSATNAFAGRLDRLFAAVAAVAQQTSHPAAPTETGITPATAMVGGFSASTILWVSALMLLLGTVGVLVTTKIALATMLALGPMFIIFALFNGTRGLFEGWCKATVLFAIVPLLAVLIGGGAVMALEPVVRAIALDGETPSTQAVAVLFLGASVYLALMVMAVRTATTLVTGWRIPGQRSGATTPPIAVHSVPTLLPPAAFQAAGSTYAHHGNDDRVRSITASLPAPREEAPFNRSGPAAGRPSAQIIPIAGSAARMPQADQRAQGVGSRFRTRHVPLSKDRLS